MAGHKSPAAATYYGYVVLQGSVQGSLHVTDVLVTIATQLEPQGVVWRHERATYGLKQPVTVTVKSNLISWAQHFMV